MTKQVLLAIFLLTSILLPVKKSIAQYNYDWSGNLKAYYFTDQLNALSMETDDHSNLYLGFSLDGNFDLDMTAIEDSVQESNSDNNIAKYSPQGDLLKVIDFGPAHFMSGNIVKYDHHGHIYVAAVGNSVEDFDPSAAVNPGLPYGPTFYLAKYDTSLNLIWVKSMVANYLSTAGINIKDIEISPDGNINVAGIIIGSFDFDPGVGIDSVDGEMWGDIFISRFDTAGNLLWAKSDGSAGQDQPADITSDANSNIYITGQWSWSSAFLAKFSSSGDSAYNHIFSGAVGGFSFGNSVWDLGNGNINVAGYFGGQVDFDAGSGVSNGNTGDSQIWDLFFTQYDYAGNFVGVRFINAGQATIQSTRETANGHLLLSGSYYDTLSAAPPFSTLNFYNPGNNEFEMELNNSLDIIDAHAFHVNGGSLITSNNAGNLYIAMSTYDSIADLDPGAGVVALYNDGNPQLGIAKWGGSVSAVKQIDAPNSHATIYPNPSNGLFDLEIQSATAGKMEISITDMFGRTITQQTVVAREGTNQLSFNLSNQSAGIYFVNCSSGSQSYSTKLVVVH